MIHYLPPERILQGLRIKYPLLDDQQRANLYLLLRPLAIWPNARYLYDKELTDLGNEQTKARR